MNIAHTLNIAVRCLGAPDIESFLRLSAVQKQVLKASTKKFLYTMAKSGTTEISYI